MSVKLPVPEIILASTSPRRTLLLERIGLAHIIIAPDAEELVPPHGDCKAIALHNARIKAESVIHYHSGSGVMGVDTIVDLDGEPLGKPVGIQDAIAKLTKLSGRDHFVHTAVYFGDSLNNLHYELVETSVVKFRRLGRAEIESYVATGEPLDKAGAYGIQERGAMLVERIEGCFFNVMGLPVARVWEMILCWMDDRGTPLVGWRGE